MKDPKRYTITAALPYANGPLHIGHMAGVYVPADIFVRFLRLKGEEVLFICGSDEHGAAITLRAKKEGITPNEIIDKYHGQNKSSFANFGIDFDIFHRTSTELHQKTAQDFFLKLNDKGSFEIREGEQFYDEKEGHFLADRYIVGTCPNCGFDNAFGDQCEKCGTSLSPQELIDPRSALSGERPVLRPTRHWYLPMQNHEDWLRDWLVNGQLDGKPHHDPKDWKRQVIGQCKSWLDNGLRPRAMTRDLDWGVPVPLKEAEGKVLYVWLDAPIGYISATKQWAEDNHTDWERWWKDEDSELIHFLAKDNIVFHCLIFPILLREHGEFLLPTNVPANEFLNLEGQKLSTSRNWAVWLHEYLEDMPNREDELRYVLNAVSPEFRDSEFTWADYQNRVNNELVAVFGNFVNRTLVLTNKYYEGEVPAVDESTDAEVWKTLKDTPQRVSDLMHQYRFREAQNEAMALARVGNKFLTETEPWKLKKTDPERTRQILGLCLQLCASASVVLRPFLPNSCQKLSEMLDMKEAGWWDATNPMLQAGHSIQKASLLFQKVEDDVIEKQTEKLKAKSAEAAKPKQEPVKPAIDFDTFTSLDMRTGVITEAEKVPKTKKLLKLSVDIGSEKRTVVSGIAEYYSADEVIGKEVALLLNLQPRKIRGIMSEGMILMAEDADGKLAFLSPEAGLSAGSKIR